MKTRDAQFAEKLLATFKVEAQEHLHNIVGGLIQLEQGGAHGAGIVETVFRETHSLKGAARAVNLPNIESLCQLMENMLADVKDNRIRLSERVLNTLHENANVLTEALAIKAPVIETQSGQPAAPSVRISTSKLDPLFLQAEQLLLAKQAAADHVSELKDLLNEFHVWADSSGAANFRLIEQRLRSAVQSAENDRHRLSVTTDGILENVRRVLMLPFSSILESFPKLVHDLARDREKQAELITTGTDIEIDKRILDEIKDPLIHLVRNAIDHGIETPAARARAGKRVKGTVHIAIEQQGSGKIEITVSDDGLGVDLERLSHAAVEKNIISPTRASQLSPAEVTALMFKSGISTASTINEISGRGLGLAIVVEKVERLGGSVAVESLPGVGAEFKLSLPVSLLTLRGLLVRCAEQTFVIPTPSVERILKVDPQQIRQVESRQTINVSGQPTSLVELARVLGIPEAGSSVQPKRVTAVIVQSAASRIAFAVAEILGEQEFLMKPLGRQLSRVRNIAGATILNSGTVVCILNVPDLLRSAVRSNQAPVLEPGAGKPTECREKTILVVDDSITARTLLKNVLETAGYHVVTATDGIDALGALLGMPVDLIVSDVEMPRMNGFELTLRVREHKTLSKIPVILVTALESEESRARGLDVGADAYIVKSSFDESNLLGVARRLI